MVRLFLVALFFSSLFSIFFCSKYTRKGEFLTSDGSVTIAIPVSDESQTIAVDLPNIAGATIIIPSGALPANSHMSFKETAPPVDLASSLGLADLGQVDGVNIEITDENGMPIEASKPILLNVPQGKYDPGSLVIEKNEQNGELYVSETINLPLDESNVDEDSDENSSLEDLGLIPPPAQDPTVEKAENYCGLDTSETGSLISGKLMKNFNNIKKYDSLNNISQKLNAQLKDTTMLSPITKSSNLYIQKNALQLISLKSAKLIGREGEDSASSTENPESQPNVFPRYTKYASDGEGLLAPIRVEAIEPQMNNNPYWYGNYSTELLVRVRLSDDYAKFLNIMYENQYKIDDTVIAKLKEAMLGNFAEKLLNLQEEGKSYQLSYFEVIVNMVIRGTASVNLQRCTGSIKLFPPLRNGEAIDDVYSQTFTQEDFLASSGMHYIKCNIQQYGLGMIYSPHMIHEPYLYDHYMHDFLYYEEFYLHMNRFQATDISAQDFWEAREVEVVAQKQTEEDKKVSDASQIPPSNPNEPTPPTGLPPVPESEEAGLDPNNFDPVCKTLSNYLPTTAGNLHLIKADLSKSIVYSGKKTSMFPMSYKKIKLHLVSDYAPITSGAGLLFNPVMGGGAVLNSFGSSQSSVTSYANNSTPIPSRGTLQLTSSVGTGSSFTVNFSPATLSLGEGVTIDSLSKDYPSAGWMADLTYEAYVGGLIWPKPSPFSIMGTGTKTITSFPSNLVSNLSSSTEATGSATFTNLTSGTYMTTVIAKSSDGKFLVYEPKTFTIAIPETPVEEEEEVEEEVVVDQPLFAFTTHTFNNCTQTGRLGPSLDQCKTAYTDASWSSNVSYYNVSSGYQLWTVPKTGVYSIEAYGARGGTARQTGGNGAYLKGDFTLTKNDQLLIVVGQKGYDKDNTDWGGGGGGGTFVTKIVASGSYQVASLNHYVEPLIVAGGGGGSYDNAQDLAGEGGVFTTGETTNGGDAANSQPSGGGGFVGNSTNSLNNYIAYSFLNGANGCDVGIYDGGFGGGGCPYDGGGGGGGYQGGSTSNTTVAHGGYSFNSGSNTSGTSAQNDGHGQVVITFQP